MENLPPDPLLKAGAYIDPASPAAYDDSTSNPAFPDPDPMPAEPTTPIHNSSGAAAESSEATPRPNLPNADAELPDWLPVGWGVEFRVRSSGATAGHRDKYFFCPDTKRRFRSRKEVMSFLETGEVVSKKKKKNDGPDSESAPSSNKRKKITPKASVENFKFHDVPAKVKWVLTDIYEGSWRPLVGGVDRVSEADKQEWAAAFRYLSLQKNGSATASLT